MSMRCFISRGRFLIAFGVICGLVPASAHAGPDSNGDGPPDLLVSAPQAGHTVGTIENDDLPTRVFVAPRTGNDNNQCHVQTTPCQSILAALDQVAANGEMILLETAAYVNATPITIGKAVRITASAGITAVIGQRLAIDVPGGRVSIRGVEFKGVAALALLVYAADSVSLEHVVIDGWHTAINANGSPHITLSNVVLRNNYMGIEPGAGATTLSIENSLFDANVTGIALSSSQRLIVRHSAFVNHVANVIQLSETAVASIHDAVFFGTQYGAAVITLGGSATIGRSHIYGNAFGLYNFSGALNSTGTNVVRGNTTNTQGTITPVPEG